MYREEKWYSIDIIGVCLDFRMGFRGSSDTYYCTKHLLEFRKYLAEKLNRWSEPSDKIDEAIKTILKETCSMIDSQMKARIKEPSILLRQQYIWGCPNCKETESGLLYSVPEFNDLINDWKEILCLTKNH